MLTRLHRWIARDASRRALADDLQARLDRYRSGPPKVRFRCNVCGASCRCAPEELHRERPSCARCGSTMRWRSIVAALSKELFGASLALPDFPVRPDLVGLGMSDEACYAVPLARKLSYTNTFFDGEPRFDVTKIEPHHVGKYDFVISSDVFEHVPPPPAAAFANARRLLRPGGVLVFSVPYRPEGATEEHFPELFDYRLVETPSGRRLRNTTRDGLAQEFDDLVFHGGGGFTVEMRVFSRAGVERCAAEAGFQQLTVHADDDPELGLLWKDERWSHVMTARG